MGYQIRIERRAERGLARLTRRDRRQIIKAIDDLAEDPRPAGCVPVKAAPRGTYRVRVGDYRVIYLVLDDDEGLVTVTRVRRRGGDTYKGL